METDESYTQLLIKAADIGSEVLREEEIKKAEKEKEKLEKEKTKNTSYKNGNGIPNTNLKQNEYPDYDKQVKNGNH